MTNDEYTRMQFMRAMCAETASQSIMYAQQLQLLDNSDETEIADNANVGNGHRLVGDVSQM